MKACIECLVFTFKDMYEPEIKFLEDGFQAWVLHITVVDTVNNADTIL